MNRTDLATDRARFFALADAVCAPVPDGRVTLYLSAEDSDFLRFNQGKARQITHVRQLQATLSVVRGARMAQSTVSLTGTLDQDAELLLAEREALTAALSVLPDDPHLLLPDEIASSDHDVAGALPSAGAVMARVAELAEGLDFVGFYAGGPVVRAFADSRGQRNWHRVETFHFSWCVYRRADKAARAAYAGTVWSDEAFAARLRASAAQALLLDRPSRRLSPGPVRAWFTPTAVEPLLNMLTWGGFGIKERRAESSPLIRLIRGEVALDPRVDLREATARGTAPAFTSQGFLRPPEVPLIVGGRSAGELVSPRSAREYGVAANGAEAHEAPESLSLAPGDLAPGDALSALGTGLWVSNLWYLNYSSWMDCRMTGMTRFACFWVEDGQLAAPLEVMRFDDSLLRMLGEGLEALGAEAELLPDDDTWRERKVSSMRAPGLLVRDFKLSF